MTARHPRSTGADERCRCGRPADWEMTGHTIADKPQLRPGTDKTEQPFTRYYLCDRCCRHEITSPDPPRGAVALPHHQKALLAAHQAAVNALLGDVEPLRLDDTWGLP